MNTHTRTYNAVKNATISLSIQLITLVVSFVGRTIFIKVLGDQYLGISGLYTNILSVLSLADLGITTVMTFSLYKPIAENDTERIGSLMAYFKKMYRCIALAIFALGMAVVPFLTFIVKGSELPVAELRIYYVIFLLNSVCSYLVVYKTTLIQADQRVFILKIASFIARMVTEAALIVILLLTGNYFLYLVISILITLLKNIALSLIADKLYPFLRKKKAVKVADDQQKQIVDNIKSLFIYRISAMIMNSTDNILISVILGTVIVGYYSNYLVIITALNTFIMLLAQSVLSSIGNHNASEDTKHKLGLFRVLILIFTFIGTFSVCCFQTVFNDFIYLWIGKDNPSYILSSLDVACISFNFFVSCIMNPIWMYREATGMFKKTRYSMTVAAILNIVLSVVLGNLMGLGGIIAATALAKLLTNFWYEPIVLYRDVFECKLRGYWFYMLRMILCAGLTIASSVLACVFIPVGIGFMFLKIAINGVCTVFVFAILNIKAPEIKMITGIAKKYLKKAKKDVYKKGDCLKCHSLKTKP